MSYLRDAAIRQVHQVKPGDVVLDSESNEWVKVQHVDRRLDINSNTGRYELMVRFIYSGEPSRSSKWLPQVKFCEVVISK